MQIAGNAEVHDHDAPRERQHDVLRLQVAMHERGGVDRLETRQQLGGELSCANEIQRSALPQELGEGGAVHELHGHHLVAVLNDQVEDPADVRRDNLACGADLTPEQIPRALVPNQIGSKNLECHLDMELHIEGMPHLSLTAATENAQKPIAAAENQPGAEATGVARDGGKSLRDTLGRRLSSPPGRGRVPWTESA
jgi:hypothetical protein